MAPSSAAGAGDAANKTAVQNPNPNPNPKAPPSILNLSFNQDRGCFTVGTTAGFTVFTTNPLTRSFGRDFSGAGISLVQMIYSCNILALVGGGPNPKFPPTKVMLWDDNINQSIGELSFRTNVRSVRLRRDRIVVVLLHKIYVYNLNDLKLLHQIETEANPKGLCEITHSRSMVLVSLGLLKGQVRVDHYGLLKTKLIMAHDSDIACVALANDGKLVATASSKGTLIRLFDSLDGSLLRELRRGSAKAEIYSLSFSSNAQWLALSSDKGTVHVFSIKLDSGCLENSRLPVAETNNQTPASPSRLSFIKGALPGYFSSEWSVARFHVQEGLKHIVAFGREKNTVIVITTDGRFYKCKFDPLIGGQMMIQLEHHNFLSPELYL